VTARRLGVLALSKDEEYVGLRSATQKDFGEGGIDETAL
jgi:hypothetical protein